MNKTQRFITFFRTPSRGTTPTTHLIKERLKQGALLLSQVTLISLIFNTVSYAHKPHKKTVNWDYSLISHMDMSIELMQQIQKDFVHLIQEEGFSKQVVQKAEAIDLHSLIKLLNLSSQSKHPNWDRLKDNIRYWQDLLAANEHPTKGRASLEAFILHTEHSNGFHLFNINQNSWHEFLNLMLQLKIFSSIQGPEPRSFKSFVLQYKWLEGAQTSQKRSAEYWAQWSQFFSSKKGYDIPKIGEALYQTHFDAQGRQHSDGVQSLYLGLTPPLLDIIQRHPELMTPEVVEGLFTRNLTYLSIFAEQLGEVFSEQQQNKTKSSQQKTHEILRAIESLAEYGTLTPTAQAIERAQARAKPNRPQLCLRYLN